MTMPGVRCPKPHPTTTSMIQGRPKGISLHSELHPPFHLLRPRPHSPLRHAGVHGLPRSPGTDGLPSWLSDGKCYIGTPCSCLLFLLLLFVFPNQLFSVVSSLCLVLSSPKHSLYIGSRDTFAIFVFLVSSKTTFASLFVI